MALLSAVSAFQLKARAATAPRSVAGSRQRGQRTWRPRAERTEASAHSRCRAWPQRSPTSGGRSACRAARRSSPAVVFDFVVAAAAAAAAVSPEEETEAEAEAEAAAAAEEEVPQTISAVGLAYRPSMSRR